MRAERAAIYDDSGTFPITGQTCALCAVYWDEYADDNTCAKCPLAISRGGVACTDEMRGEMSPFDIWLYYSNPAPMLHALRLAQSLTP